MISTNSIISENAPLQPDQRSGLNHLLNGLTSEQLLWLEGFISGLRVGRTSMAASGDAAPAAKPELTVLYGTESGNSESLADQTVKTAQSMGFKARSVNMADIKVSKLQEVRNLLVIVSTWGEGDPPETASAFYQAFMSEQAPRMEQTRYSVLGLGDTSYEHFCKMGKDFDVRLEALGAERIYARRDCDVDYDDDFASWHEGALKALLARSDTAPSTTHASATLASETALPQAVAPVQYSRKNPYPAELKERVLLNGKGSNKETIHVEFDLHGSGLSYEVGDALAVIPHNASDLVEALLKATHLDGSAQVQLKDGAFSLHEALTSQLDMTALSKPVLSRYNEFAKSASLDAIINDQDQLSQYVNGRDVIDLVRDFPASEFSVAALASIMRKLPPRLYSIASSPKAHPDEVHLTVGVVRYDAYGRQRKGVCSSYLAERIEEGQKAEVFISPNKHFKLPADPGQPIIMVGPGTGIAPFRAFMEERKAIGAPGKNWLFFGDQHYLTDFLYQTEWQDYLADGLLTRLDLAFSRDQKKKIYVQDRMKEKARDLYAWLLEGATFYVCGDASRMAHDVDKALHEIIASEGKLSDDAAAEFVQQLKTGKRYLRDVY